MEVKRLIKYRTFYMETLHLITFIGYFAAILAVIFITYKKQNTETDFVIGGRGLNFYLTALSAHASDMSGWLFIAYPAMIFTQGVFGAWAAIGLTLFMYLNWQFIAPRIRTTTEQFNSLTLNAYFENRFVDKTGIIRLISAIMTLAFYTIYISSGLNALGLLGESLFNLDYSLGITLGLGLVAIYVFVGGYTTIAWIDLFQGFFLLGVIIFIPVYLLFDFGGFAPIMDTIKQSDLSFSLFPDFSLDTIMKVLIITLGWGLGYLGQPHILTKFMGIKRVEEIPKAKYLGMSWQILALGSATVIGLIGIHMFFQSGLDPESLIISIVNKTLTPFFTGLVLCAILAATTNVMAAQILVVASSLSEDFYKRWVSPLASSKHLLHVSRLSVVLVSVLAYIIAYLKVATIYKLVLFAWSGLGASFGPLVLISLYSKSVNKYGAFAGILAGGIIAAISPLFKGSHLIWEYPIIPGFILSTLCIYLVSYLTSINTNKQVINE